MFLFLKNLGRQKVATLKKYMMELPNWDVLFVTGLGMLKGVLQLKFVDIQNKLISKISVDYKFMLMSNAWLCTLLVGQLDPRFGRQVYPTR